MYDAMQTYHWMTYLFLRTNLQNQPSNPQNETFSDVTNAQSFLTVDPLSAALVLGNFLADCCTLVFIA